MRKTLLACWVVAMLLLSGTLVAFANSSASDTADYQNFDYVFYSYEEFREAFPLTSDRYVDNHYFSADELMLSPDSIVVDVMLPCGEIVYMTIYLNGTVNDVRTSTYYASIEAWFDSYADFRDAFPLSDGISSIDRMSSCGGSYRISASRLGCDFFQAMGRCVRCNSFSVPMQVCVGKRYEIRQDCSVCGPQRWVEIRGPVCSTALWGSCVNRC